VSHSIPALPNPVLNPEVCSEPALSSWPALEVRQQMRSEFLRYGAAVLGPPALPISVHQALLQESHSLQHRQGWRLYAEHVPGEISQDSSRAYLGPAARAFLLSASVRDLLYCVTGCQLEPGWSASCYTYYGPHQYMGEHCDKHDVCRIALLLYLDVTWPSELGPGPGMTLHVFRGDNSSTGLSTRITSRGNRLVILNGAVQAHLRPRLTLGEQLVLLAGCYRLTET